MHRVVVYWVVLAFPFLTGFLCGGENAPLDAPEDEGFPFGPDSMDPSEPAPTGTRWVDTTVEDNCGREVPVWVLADEICSGMDEENYLESLAVPMFRDGVLVGGHLYVVDATHIWVLDADDPDAVDRVSLSSGFGRPLSVSANQESLLIAAGEEGLVVANVDDPERPRVESRLALEGPAMDVYVHGNQAFVASGAAGLSIVDLAMTPPALIATIPLPGFAAGVVADDEWAYVAACGTLAIVDLAQGEVVASTWIADAYLDDLLVAPAKDVALFEDVVFVAAGRYGVIAVNVSDPTTPNVLGNFTDRENLAFYVSGVRTENGKLFVAAGEWGVIGIPADEPDVTFADMTVPEITVTEVPERDCSTDGPWVELPPVWDPPPPGQDPVQVLPVDGTLYAFGDATRVGIRAVDLYSVAEDVTLTRAGRFQEPTIVSNVAASGGRVLILGNSHNLYIPDAENLLTQTSGGPEGVVDDAVFLEDGRWAARIGQEIWVEGEDAPTATIVDSEVVPGPLVASGSDLLLAHPSGGILIDLESGVSTQLSADRTAQLPPVAEALNGDVFLAAPEWEQTLNLNSNGPTALSPHGVFTGPEVVDIELWRLGPPNRVLVGTSLGLLEVATLGGRGGAVLHTDNVVFQRATVPFGAYVDGVAVDEVVYLITGDRRTYRSMVVTLELTDNEIQVVSVESFTGVGVGIAVDGDRLYVADADQGIRVYTLADDGLTAEGIFNPEMTP